MQNPALVCAGSCDENLSSMIVLYCCVCRHRFLGCVIKIYVLPQPTRALLFIAQVTVDIFFVVLLLANVVIGMSLSIFVRPTSPNVRNVGVPLIHWDDVGPLRTAIKRRFPSKKDMSSLQLRDVGEVACGLPTAR